jgi:flavin reductase (DIM6/NTAB) family NADH-FMN oxidoreductase RutF
VNPAVGPRTYRDTARPHPWEARCGPWHRGETDGVGPDLFRAVLRHHAAGVAVITAGTETPVGFCATSLASVSLEPQLVSFAVALESASWATLESARHVAVHLLTDRQEEIARRFARPREDKFGPGTAWRRGPYGLPVLDDVLAWMVLEPTTRLIAGDHALVVSQVVEAWHGADRGPLVYHDGGFLGLPPE